MELFAVGKIVGCFGIRGVVKVQPLTHSLERLKKLKNIIAGRSEDKTQTYTVSHVELKNGVIMMKRSSVFFAVIIALAVVRYAARSYFDRFMTLEQTGALFYLLAFGMILRWRAKLYFAYRTLTNTPLPLDSALEETGN